MDAERVKPPVNRKKNWVAAVLVLPGVLFVVFFMLVPLFSLCLTSFFPDESFSLSSYFSLFGDLYFQQVFMRSLRLSLLSTAICALLGFPTAYYIAKHSRHKGMMMAFAVFPMFTSPVIRSFSWMVILGKKGIVNSALVSLGIFAKPQSLLYFRSGDGKRACLYRLHDGVYDAAAAGRHGYTRAGDDDLSICDEPSRLDAGFRRCCGHDCGDDGGFQRVQRAEPQD